MLEQSMQDKIYQLLVQVESVAVELKLKLRLLDAIRDIKNKLKTVLSKAELRQIIVEIDELIFQLKKQIEPVQKEIVVNDYAKISEIDIKNRIINILSEANRVSATLAEENMQGYETYLIETENAMQDFTKVEANYKTILSPQRLQDKFGYIGKCHNSQINVMLNRCIDEIAENYDHAIKQIGTMFSGIKDARVVFGQKELYQQWTERYDTIKGNLKEETEAIDKGGNEVVDFYNEHEKSIKKIVKKNQKKYFRKKCIPLYAFLLAVVVFFSANMISIISEEQKNTVESETTSTEQEDVMTDSIGSLINTIVENKDVLQDITNQVNDKKEPAGKSGLWISLLSIFVCAALWYWWICRQNKECKEKICEETGSYLSLQLETFRKDQRLHRKTVQSYNESVKKVIAAYEEICSRIFAFVLYDEREDENSSVARLISLCNEWENIKRGNV
ncbi:MAG: hypothetical protein IJE49_08585 [Agathobacter sp.]|nr:hypothetical protein [Agathobacter sp.]